MDTRGHRLTYRPAHGFTLVELLVALAILVVVMAGLMMLFAGSIRAVRQGYQAMDAFERARGTLTVLENDLATAFASLDYGDTYTFYGAPLGMTFMGLDRSATGSKGLARITSVVYNDPQSIPFLDALDRDPEGLSRVDAYPYPLLRYVEPDVAALDDFYIDWADPRGDGLDPPYDGESLEPLLNAVLAGTQPRYGEDCEDCDRCRDCPDCENCQYDSANLTEEQEQRVWAKKCELWIRMLAGGDDVVPIDFWTDVPHPDPENPGGLLALSFEDYIVTENLLSTNSPRQRNANTFGPNTDTFNCIGTSECHHFFDYRYRPEVKVSYDAGTPSFWWNAPCAYNWPEDPENPDREDWLRLPGAVDVGFWLMFEAATVGGPDFKRWFSLQIDVPAGYSPPEE